MSIELIHFVSASISSKFTNSRNFMTPIVMGYYKIKDIYIEISTGNKFPDNNGKEMFGVTLCIHDDALKEKYDKCCHSTKEWQEYLLYLKKELISAIR